MNSRVRFSPVLFLASAYLAGLMGCAQEEQAAPAASLAPVLGVPVRLLDVTENVEATGQLIAKFEAAMASQVNGQVTSKVTTVTIADVETPIVTAAATLEVALDASGNGVISSGDLSVNASDICDAAPSVTLSACILVTGA